MKFNNLKGIKRKQENDYEENRLLQIAKDSETKII